ELRAFKRVDERVEVYKLESVTGPREFFRNYELVVADTGVAFTGHEEFVDSRAPNDPRCHVQLEVDYHYEPSHDALALRRQKVAIDIHDGHCVLAASQMGDAKLLARVDRGTSDPRWTEAPAGKPIRSTAEDSMDNVLNSGAKTSPKLIKQEELAKKNAGKKAQKPQVGNAPSQSDKQIAPPPQAPPGDMATQAPAQDLGQQAPNQRKQ